MLIVTYLEQLQLVSSLLLKSSYQALQTGAPSKVSVSLYLALDDSPAIAAVTQKRRRAALRGENDFYCVFEIRAGDKYLDS